MPEELSEFNSRDLVFFHAVRHSPEIGFTGMDLKDREQRIFRLGDPERLHKRPVFDAFGSQVTISDESHPARYPHDFAEILAVEIDFNAGVFLELFAHRFDGLRLKIESGLIREPHSQTPHARPIALDCRQIAVPVLICKISIFFQTHGSVSPNQWLKSGLSYLRTVPAAKGPSIRGVRQYRQILAKKRGRCGERPGEGYEL